MTWLFSYITNNNATGTNEQLDAALANLADISVGQTPSIWPLAWGWWVLLAFTLLLLVGLVWLTLKHFKKRIIKRSALKSISNINHSDPQRLQKLHAILRSAVIHYFPNEDISGLHGNDWQNFLQNSVVKPTKLDKHYMSQLKELEASLYSKTPSINIIDAKETASWWIKHNLPPAKKASEPSQQDTALGVQHV
jgi:hypothetical protein